MPPLADWTDIGNGSAGPVQKRDLRKREGRMPALAIVRRGRGGKLPGEKGGRFCSHAHGESHASARIWLVSESCRKPYEIEVSIASYFIAWHLV